MLRIVAVDDNTIIQQLLKMTFSLDEKINGHVFSNAQDALDYALINAVNLFIIDWRMPGTCGSSLLETLRSIPRYKEVPIVILSGDDEVEDIERAKTLGATGWIVKPFNPQSLRCLICKLSGFFSGLPIAKESNVHLF